MSADSWRRVKEVCAGALERTGGDRSAYLEEACAGDADLRAEVDSLIGAHDRAGEFIEQPAVLHLAAPLDDEALLAAADPNLGRAVGPYLIDAAIGRGGMGTVYLGRRVDREFEQRVAIKMIRRGMDSELVIKRFRHERQILASLEHPNVARLFDGGTSSDGLPYFVMEYVDGLPIDRYADVHRLSTAERLRLCLGVFDAVQHAHERGIIHRDLKPGNVLVTAGGHPKLLDFGIAKILDPEGDGASTFTSVARPMTPDYASPEQVQGRLITPASDVYALGLLLYELLTGHRPFRFEQTTPDERARVVCEEDPERPSTVIDREVTAARDDGTVTRVTPETVSGTRDGSVERLRARLSGALDAIVLKALRKEPDERYASVADLAADVRRYLDARPVVARSGAWRYHLVRRARRHRATLVTAALLIVAIATTAVLTRGWRREAATDGLRGASGSDSAASSAPQARRSVAVLDFRNLSGAASDAWLSTAIAEMLTTELAGEGQVRTVPAERMARTMRDLQIPPGGPASGSVDVLRRALGVDLVVAGTFASTNTDGRPALRLDVRVHGDDEAPVALAAHLGDPAHLFDLVAEAGRDVRLRLGLQASTPESRTAARAAFPTGLEATRLYAEGMARLRVLDAVTARERLAAAAALEPANPLIQTALASAWAALGYDARSADAAQRAFDASSALSREDRLNVEGRLHEARRQWTKAVDVYRTLWGFFADNVEYGLRLATVQTASGGGKDALETVAALRQLPRGSQDDPRIDLQEAEAASGLGDLPRELTALRRAVAAATARGARGVLARARLLEGRSLYNQGQPEAARASIEIAQRLFEEVGDRAGVASTQNSLASVVSETDLGRSAELYEASLRTSEEIGDRRAMSAALNNLGITLKDQRRYDDALAAHQRALALRRDIGDRNWTAVSLSNIGVVYFEQDRFAEAARSYEESLAVAREIGDARGQVRAQHNLAIVMRELGRLGAARQALNESLAIRRRIGDRRGQVFAQVELGILLLAEAHVDDARRMQESVRSLAGEMTMRAGEAQALYQLAEIALVAGDLPAARRQHEQALALRRELGETRTVLESESALAVLRLAEGQPVDAESEARRLLGVLGRDAAAPARVALHLLIARARLAHQDVGGATEALAAAAAAGGRTERIELRHQVSMVEAEVALVGGDRRRARELLRRQGQELQAAGMTLADFERRLLLATVDQAERQPGVLAALTALESDARAAGAGGITARAAALRSR